MFYALTAILLLISLGCGFWLTLHINKRLDD